MNSRYWNNDQCSLYWLYALNVDDNGDYSGNLNKD